jgi:nucleoside-diphosphate-sugar epimerase
MRALVTGGAGFIGSHVVEELLRAGNSVRVLDDFSNGKPENLAGMPGKLEILEGDLRDKAMVRTAVHDVEVIFHLAAFISVPQSMADPETCFAINVAGTVNLLEAARKAGARKVVISSSTAVYGNTNIFPTTEETPLQPLSPYAVSKQVNEIYASLYSKVLGLPVISLRYFNVYGPRQRPDSPYAAAIPIFVNHLVKNEPITIFGDGKQSRDYIFVKDVAHANLLAAKVENGGEVINICTGREITLLDLLENLSELSPAAPVVKFAEPRLGDIYRSAGCPDKAARLLGFKAETSLGEGLKQSLEWIQKL